jgi:hypothetical protein
MTMLCPGLTTDTAFAGDAYSADFVPDAASLPFGETQIFPEVRPVAAALLPEEPLPEGLLPEEPVGFHPSEPAR